ncbi:hypothetical protein GGTG_11902 [Gaeumannomyces tritici R3-111a-1]|uniref:Uncharacterized protein n=1 Tax=Gaeumannomyces tritici (strain R3-111a-1) TaxID=644352 RepID=J3PEH1_GAET3|nr:hypothetical protein GGTG_11902 [Gaeumannomyces tritici R3-111a-1]EJT70879.1 hypothetical protein GGTG_11902 [Gaeumannomyces tritici R3-111a-1]
MLKPGGWRRSFSPSADNKSVFPRGWPSLPLCSPESEEKQSCAARSGRRRQRLLAPLAVVGALLTGRRLGHTVQPTLKCQFRLGSGWIAWVSSPSFSGTEPDGNTPAGRYCTTVIPASPYRQLGTSQYVPTCLLTADACPFRATDIERTTKYTGPTSRKNKPRRSYFDSIRFERVSECVCECVCVRVSRKRAFERQNKPPSFATLSIASAIPNVSLESTQVTVQQAGMQVRQQKTIPSSWRTW